MIKSTFVDHPAIGLFDSLEHGQLWPVLVSRAMLQLSKTKKGRCVKRTP